MVKGRVIFHKLVTPDEALKTLREYVEFKPLGIEVVPLEESYGRVLAEDIRAPIDVPPYDISTVDGYAVRSIDVVGAREDNPVRLKVVGYIEAGSTSKISIGPYECVEVATGAPIPQGANAVVMVEYTKRVGDYVEIFKPVTPGENIFFTASDVMMGETVVYRGTRITPQVIGVLAALGIRYIKVYKRPRVAIVSTGNELTEPGKPLTYGRIYDVNSYTLYSLVLEDGGKPNILGILPDDYNRLMETLTKALKEYDVVITSGGTSAGVGDLVYRVLNELGEPGVIVHGLNIKPGKPTVIAVINGKPVFGLPGYPISCIISYNLIVKPLIRALSGLGSGERRVVKAYLASRVYGAKGRRTIVPVSLIRRSDRWIAYPLTITSGSICRLLKCDGYIVIPENTLQLEEGSSVDVNLYTEGIVGVDLEFIGSHCFIVERVLDKLRGKYNVRLLNVGSVGGLIAIRNGEADITGIHLLDEETGEYNIPYIEKYGLSNIVVVRGYYREQGIIVAKGNPLNIKSFEDIIEKNIRFINRNRGSGTRVLIDLLIADIARRKHLSFNEVTSRINGYWIEAKTHSAVASAIKYGKADAGIGLRVVAEMYNLDFIPIRSEEYDFIIRKDALSKNCVKEFLEILRSDWLRKVIDNTPGYKARSDMGEVVIEL
ncbi:MAG TPA: molybdopterin biosynthesis protein [Desulfurococcales archaeon]|nr:molybdopterin biosynthesis protein [Desulfurococcales archaeon]